MMTIGDIRAATTALTTKREDWEYRAVESNVSQLAEAGYSYGDIFKACIEIAEDPNNRAPVTLIIKAPERIARAHATTHRRPVYRPGQTDPNRTCNECGLVEDLCQASAGNRGSNWTHAFLSVVDATA